MVRNRAQVSENGRYDYKNERWVLENRVLFAKASTGNDLARIFACKRVFLLYGRLIPDFRKPVNPWFIGEMKYIL